MYKNEDGRLTALALVSTGHGFTGKFPVIYATLKKTDVLQWIKDIAFKGILHTKYPIGRCNLSICIHVCMYLDVVVYVCVCMYVCFL